MQNFEVSKKAKERDANNFIEEESKEQHWCTELLTPKQKNHLDAEDADEFAGFLVPRKSDVEKLEFTGRLNFTQEENKLEFAEVLAESKAQD